MENRYISDRTLISYTLGSRYFHNKIKHNRKLPLACQILELLDSTPLIFCHAGVLDSHTSARAAQEHVVYSVYLNSLNGLFPKSFRNSLTVAIIIRETLAQFDKI